jgi:alanine racemase
MHRDLVAEINTDALLGNAAAVRSICGPAVSCCAVVKSNAYGHEAGIVGPVLERAGITTAAVATISEALSLRDAGFTGGVLCFGPLFSAPTERERTERIAAAVAFDLTPTLVDGRGLRDLDAAGRRYGRRVGVHINVDTGMSRLGVSPTTAVRLAHEVARLDHVTLAGLYTHLANADLADLSSARAQLAVFANVAGQLRAASMSPAILHAANSAGLMRLAESRLDMVRPGLLLYGCVPAPTVMRPAGLRPVLRLRSRLVMVKRVPAGTPVGYGGTFVTRRESIIGVVPIGYNDGYLRGLSNRAVMGLPYGDAPVIGAISMDQCVLDLTGLTGAAVGDPVVIIDDLPERPNSLESLAAILGTIPYELACLLGNRIRRVPVGDAAEEIKLPETHIPSPGEELLRHAAVIRHTQRRGHLPSQPLDLG